MSSEAPSRILDTITTDQPNDKTCTHSTVYVGHPHDDPHTAIELRDQSAQCGKPATHITFKTCCGAVSYQCDEHAPSFPAGAKATVCLECRHRCVSGVCCHRIVTPL